MYKYVCFSWHRIITRRDMCVFHGTVVSRDEILANQPVGKLLVRREKNYNNINLHTTDEQPRLLPVLPLHREGFETYMPNQQTIGALCQTHIPHLY